jgi:hypothetical protein
MSSAWLPRLLSLYVRPYSMILSLDSPRWHSLQHAYGVASDIPTLLRQLDTLPDSHGEAEPWFSLWSALAHQGDVYSASFAAVPHVIGALSTSPTEASFTYFQFPAWVEICRAKKNVAVPSDLLPAYSDALAKMPSLVGAAAEREWNEDFLVCAMSAIAASKGFTSVAEAAQELTPDVASEFMEWFFER